MIERSTAASGPLVASVADLNPANASKYAFDKAFESDNVVVMDLKCTEVRALKLEQANSKVQVGDSKICAALAAGPSQVQLIGASDGVTRLAVWTRNSAGQRPRASMKSELGSPKATMPTHHERSQPTDQDSAGCVPIQQADRSGSRRAIDRRRSLFK